MNRVLPIFLGFCLLVSACAGSSDTDGTQGGASSTAGSAGSDGTISSGGESTFGGASDALGGSSPGGSDTAGASNSAGGKAVGGSSPVGEPGGVTAAGGSGGAMGDSAGAAGKGGPIDYSTWLLQLPSGTGTSPTTVPGKQLSGFSDAYFYKATDGGQIFMDPATGITTSGSTHCRTEMRESGPSGGQAAWSSSGTNTMTVSGKVLRVGGGGSGSVTVGQVFNGSDSIALCELQYSVNRAGFELFYEESKGNGSATPLSTSVALNTPYTFTLGFSNGELTVVVDGKQVYSKMPTPGTAAKKFNFKVGDYDQTSRAGSVSTTPYTLVENYGITVVHK